MSDEQLDPTPVPAPPAAPPAPPVPPPAPGYAPQQPAYHAPQGAVPAAAKNKTTAGLLGIFLGAYGVHKFYLGLTTPAVILLVATVSGILFAMIGIGFLWVWIPGVIGLIEGIIYLTKSDEQFHQEYVVGKRQWF